MCGRFTYIEDDLAALAETYGAALHNDLPRLPNYNICPTDKIAVVTQGRALRAMRWGFIPHFDKSPTDRAPLINARSEGIADKPSFRWAVRHQRCLVPASGFYEWVKDGDKRLPYYIAPSAGGSFAYAGLWQDWGAGQAHVSTCAIVTCAANEKLSKLHHRQPVVIARRDWGKWLGEEGHGAAVLMKPAPEGFFDYHRVDPAVNSNRATGPELINPL